MMSIMITGAIRTSTKIIVSARAILTSTTNAMNTGAILTSTTITLLIATVDAMTWNTSIPKQRRSLNRHSG